MQKRDLDYIVITLLVGSSLYVFLTGLVADSMRLHHFGWHSQIGYLWVSLATIHLIQTWIRVKAFARYRFRGGTTGRSTSSLSINRSTQGTTQQASSLGNPSTPLGGTRNSLGRRYLLWTLLAIATGIGFDRLVTLSETVELAGMQQDLGMLYHRWSEPGYGETIGTLLN